MKEIDKKIKAIDKEISNNKSRISSPLQIPGLLIELDKSAGNNNVTIDNIIFKENSTSVNDKEKTINSDLQKAKQKTVDISFNFSGSYRDCISMLRYYEDNQHLIIITNVRIDRSSELCKGFVDMRAYWLDEIVSSSE